MSLIPRVKPSGWATNERLLSSQTNQLDANVELAGDYIELLQSIPLQSVNTYVDSGLTSTDGECVATFVQFSAGVQYGYWVIASNSPSISDQVHYSTDGLVWIDADLSTSMNTISEVACDGTTLVVTGQSVQYCTQTFTFAVATGTSGTYAAMLHDGTKFIIGGTSGTFNNSANGSAFTSRTPPTNWLAGTYTARQFATDGDRVVCVSSKAASLYFAYSDNNGDTWSEASVASLAWRGVAYYDGTWAAVASTGAVYTSTNGSTWSLAGSTGTTPMTRVYVHQGFFFFLDTNGIVNFSKDLSTWYIGANWSATSAGRSLNYLGLAYSQRHGQLMVTATDSSEGIDVGRSYTSPAALVSL